MPDTIPYKTVKEEPYLYQLPDGAVLRLEYRLERLAKNNLGGFSCEGTKKYSIQALGQDISSLLPTKFADPPCIRLGSNVYLTGDGETVHIRPQLRHVERVVDSRGVPSYVPTDLDWLPDHNRESMLKAMASPDRTFIATSRDEVVTAALREKAVLEWLFGYRWFYEGGNEKHPAYIEWRTCVQIIQRNGIKPDPVSFERMHWVAKVALDALLLVRLSEGDLKRLVPGHLQSLGDSIVQKKIASRIKTESFEDLLVELYTAAWHKREGRNVTLSETPGMPDVRVKFDSIPFPIFIECKRISVISERRIQHVINKASNQLEVASKEAARDVYGSVLLDFTAVKGAIPYTGRLIPEHIAQAIKEVKRALGGNKNTHLKSAVVVWDEYKISGKSPEPVVLLFGRRAELIHHTLNQNPLPIEKLFNGYVSGVVFESIADELR